MRKSEVIEILTRLKPVLIKRFDITRLALFGSTVRNEATDTSDIDIVVSFEVTEKAVREELRAYIKQEAINV